MKSAGKVLSVLSLYTAGRTVWSPERAARRLNVSLATSYRYFNTLVEAGMLERLQRNRYVLGPAIVELDRQIRAADPVLRIARPVMTRLLKRVRQPASVLLCRYFRQQVMCIHEESNQTDYAISSYERGARRPLFRGATSRIILANLTPRALADLWQAHKRDILAAGLGPTFEDFRAALTALRKAGVATAFGEVDAGRIGVAAPLFDGHGRIAGSVSIVLHTAQAGEASLQRLRAAVTQAAKEIETMRDRGSNAATGRADTAKTAAPLRRRGRDRT